MEREKHAENPTRDPADTEPMIYGTNSNTQDIQAHITFEIFLHLSMFVSIYTEPCGGSDAESANSTVVKSKPLDPWHGR